MSNEPITPKDIRVYASMVVSAVVLAIAGIIILSKAYPSDDVKWAFGAVGLVFGYWSK